MATQKNEEWIFSAERDGQRVLLKGYGFQHISSSILSGFSSCSLSSMSEVPRNPERVRSDGISSDLGNSGGPLRSLSDHVLSDNSDVDCTTNESTLGKFVVEISGGKFEEQNAKNTKAIPDRVVRIDSDIVYNAEIRSTDLTSSSNSAAVLENEDELEWLLTMPRMHESIAGVTALVDAYGGSCDPHAILSEVINSNGGFGDTPLRDNSTSDDDDSFSATCDDNYVVLSPQTMPLFYVELPFPVPGTSLKDWILGTSPLSRWTPPSPRRPTPSFSINTGRQYAQSYSINDDSLSVDSSSNKGRSPWELQHMARQILAIISAVHSAGKAHGAICPGAVQVEENSERVRLRVLPASLLLREMSAFGNDPLLPFLAPEILNQGIQKTTIGRPSGPSSTASPSSTPPSSTPPGTSSPRSARRTSSQLP